MKKNIWTHIGIVIVMLAVACIYFSPALGGKVILQGDIAKYEAMVKETKDYHAKTGDYALWNSALFSGMPVYQVGGNAPMKSIFTPLRNVLTLQFAGLDRSVGAMLLYLVGFYLAMLVLGCSPWLALLGALGFGLGSYNIIILEAGHVSKALALSMTAPILAGMARCLRKPREGQSKWRDWLWGSLLFTFALGLQLNFNHIQITYYTLIGAMVLGLTYAVYAAREKYLPQLMAAIGLLLLGSALAFGGNARMLMVSQQYANYTMRGGNVITVTPEDLYHDNEPSPTRGKTSGLDIDYAFSWSYGIGETYTLLVPGAMGGGSGEPVGKESATYKNFRQEQAPLYWGDQPFTSGPVYFGAIIVFLFLLGLILVKGPERWWLLAATVVAILMSWGRNFMPFNEWLFNHLPMYNKFRTPSMSLVLANVCMVILGVLGLKELMDDNVAKRRKSLALYISGGVTAVVLIGGMLLSGGFGFSGAADAQMAPQYGDQWSRIQDIFIQDRKHLFSADSWRSLLFVALAFGLLWLCTNKLAKGKAASAFVVVALALLTTVDLWSVDRRYLNEKNFVSENKFRPQPDPWDHAIDQMAAQMGDHDYRVFNMATNTFNDSKPAAFHHQIGGYSAVKMRRYQDIIDFYLSRHVNLGVLNMLNARYFVLQGGQVQRNPEALGNAWLVSDIQWVDDANGEILALNNLDPATTAVVNRTEMGEALKGLRLGLDSTATITMEHQTPYNPNYLRYHSHATTNRLAVFSEIYYEPDWCVYIDGKPAAYIRANYLLRAMVIPAGDHVIEFRDEAPLYHRMNGVTVASSAVLLLLAAGGIALYIRKRKQG